MNNNINGVVYENQENRMINYHSAIEDMYFDADVEFLTENYVTSMYNTTISTQLLLRAHSIRMEVCFLIIRRL